ncbi:hypothetical protein BJY01DRAFT_7337 [Aspergillus pseudoustus]|uniref:FAD-binding PCMH-type domain-containing protein n=1 Tax=Aspergillus pseudoustus TaxID=1810923 RepID=A0ABR4JNY9_9EURO
MEIIWRENSDPSAYEKARTKHLFNAVIPPRYPAAIAFVATEQDIIDAVNLAVSKKLRISIRAGGHSYAAWSIRDNALLLDLGGYRECGFDDETGVVKVAPSLTGRELCEYLAQKGRIFPVGHCPDVSLGGYLLGGGMGWNQPNLGWACEHIVAIDLVTASGELLCADAQQNSDLFWAARGGGPAFPGVVTRFHLQTFPAARTVRSSGYVYTVENYSPVFHWALKLAATFKDSVEIVAIGSYQDGIEAPCITIALIAFGDDEEHITQILQGVEDSHPPNPISHWVNQPTTLTEQFDLKAKSYPKEHRYYVDNAFLADETDVASILERAFTTLPTRKSLALWTSLIPASRCDLPDMALSMQSDHYFALYAIWENVNEDSRCVTWVDEVMQGVAEQSVGSYLGELDFRSRNTAYWGEKQRDKLLEIKSLRDPENRIYGCLGLEGIINQPE